MGSAIVRAQTPNIYVLFISLDLIANVFIFLGLTIYVSGWKKIIILFFANSSITQASDSSLSSISIFIYSSTIKSDYLTELNGWSLADRELGIVLDNILP